MAIALIILGITIIIFSLYSLIKESRNSEINSFQAVYENKKKDIKDTDISIAELRKEFAETILELQKEIIELKEKISTNDKLNWSENEVLEINEKEDDSDTEKESVYNGVKVNDIQNLYMQGYSIDEISEKLGISKGEILLIKDLYLK